MPKTKAARARLARRMFARLDQNTLDLYADRVDWETFRRRQRQTWDRARRADVQEEILAMLRHAHPYEPARSARVRGSFHAFSGGYQHKEQSA